MAARRVCATGERGARMPTLTAAVRLPPRFDWKDIMSVRTPAFRPRGRTLAAAVLGLGLLAGSAVPIYAAPGLNGHAQDSTPSAGPTAEPGKGLAAGDTAFVDVKVATLWTAPSSPRGIDDPALGNPVRLGAWDRALRQTEVRRALTGKTQTQALLGDEVRILETRGAWVRVAVAGQEEPGEEHGYPGWVPARQLVENPDFDRALETRDTAVVTAASTEVTDRPDGDAIEQLPFTAEVPVLARSGDRVRVALPDGSKAWADAADVDVLRSGSGPAAPKPSEIVSTARSFLGTPYLWGGTSPAGFDCSGFTWAVFRAHGIDLPRDSGPQSEGGTAVRTQDIAVGDLLFFAGRGGRGAVHHVGIYIGHGKMIHSPNASKDVEIVDWRAWDRSGQFAGAQRYL